MKVVENLDKRYGVDQELYTKKCCTLRMPYQRKRKNEFTFKPYECPLNLEKYKQRLFNVDLKGELYCDTSKIPSTVSENVSRTVKSAKGQKGESPACCRKLCALFD